MIGCLADTAIFIDKSRKASNNFGHRFGGIGAWAEQIAPCEDASQVSLQIDNRKALVICIRPVDREPLPDFAHGLRGQQRYHRLRGNFADRNLR